VMNGYVSMLIEQQGQKTEQRCTIAETEKSEEVCNFSPPQSQCFVIFITNFLWVRRLHTPLRRTITYVSIWGFLTQGKFVIFITTHKTTRNKRCSVSEDQTNVTIRCELECISRVPTSIRSIVTNIITNA